MAEALLLREDGQLHLLSLVKVLLSVFRIILVGSFEILFALSSIGRTA